MTSNLVQRKTLWSYRPYQDLGQIDHNLHNHAFDDIICKPPILENENVGYKSVYMPGKVINEFNSMLT